MATLPKADRSSTESTRSIARQQSVSAIGGLLGNMTSGSGASGIDPLSGFKKLQADKLEAKQQSIVVKINTAMLTANNLLIEHNQLLRQIIEEVGRMRSSDSSSDAPGLDLDRARGGKRGRYGSKGRERLARRQAARRAAAAERIGKNAAEAVKGARRVVRSAATKVSSAVAPVVESIKTAAAPKVRPTVSESSIRPPVATIETRPSVTEPAARPTQAAQEPERVTSRSVAGRNVTVSEARFSRALSAVRIGGVVGTAIGIMNTVDEVRDLYALRQMNKENSAEGISEEEFLKGLVEISGSVMGGLGGAAIGAQLGGALGLATGPWGGLFGALAGGLVGGALGSAAGELIGTALFDQLTGSNRVSQLDSSRVQRLIDDARRTGAGGPAAQQAMERSGLNEMLREMVRSNSITREQANFIARRVLAGQITPEQGKSEAERLKALSEGRQPQLDESESRKLREFLRVRDITEENTENYDEIRLALTRFLSGNALSLYDVNTSLRVEARLGRMNVRRKQQDRPSSEPVASQVSAPPISNSVTQPAGSLTTTDAAKPAKTSPPTSEIEPVANPVAATSSVASTAAASTSYNQPKPAEAVMPSGGGTSSQPAMTATSSVSQPSVSPATGSSSATTNANTSTPAATSGSSGSYATSETAGAAATSDDFNAELNRVSSKFSVNPADMLALMRSESSINPQAVNPTTGATGLIQFMPRTARSLGTTTEELRGMTAAQQMKYVEKYFDSVRLPSGASAGKLYAYVFLPGRANRDVLTQQGENFYEANRGLDMDRDGKITIADLDARMARYGGTLAGASAGMAAADQAQARGAGRQVVVTPGSSSEAASRAPTSTTGPSGEVPLNRRLEKQVA